MSERHTILRPIWGGRLWQSGCPVALEDIEAAEINAVVNVGHQVQPWATEWMADAPEPFRGPEQPRQRLHVHVPLWDAADCLDPVACDAAIDAAVRLLSDPWRRVLIHCEAGVFRSVHVAAGTMAAVRGWPGAHAFRQVDVVGKRSSLGMSGWHEHVDTFANRRASPSVETETYTCYHCKDTFDADGARQHFGRRSAAAKPVCVALADRIANRIRGPFQSRKAMWAAIRDVRTMVEPLPAPPRTPSTGQHDKHSKACQHRNSTGQEEGA